MKINLDSMLVVKAMEEGKIRNIECLALTKDIQRLIDTQRLIEEHEIVLVFHAYI